MQDFEASDGVVTTNTATMYIATRMGRSVLAQLAQTRGRVKANQWLSGKVATTFLRRS